MNSTPLAQDEEAPAQTIEYGDVIWTKHKTNERFDAFIPGVGGAVLTKYTDDEKSHSFGKWHWCVYLYEGCLKDKEISGNLSHRSGISDDIDDAMLNCLNARSDLIADCLSIIRELCPDDSYSTGFRDGQEDIKSKIAEVVL